MQKHVVIIGAGISGLSIGLALKKRDIDFLLLEAKSVAGGNIQTIHRDGYLCEAGPNTFMLSNSEVTKTLEETGLLRSALDAAPDAKNRFVVQNGNLVPLPNSPLDLITTNVLSWKAKLRIFQEPWIDPTENGVETLAQFIRRRFGDEPLRELVDPFVSGIYGGDPERLIASYAFPQLVALERSYKSLLRGMIQRERKNKRRLLSWPGGLSELASGLAKILEDKIRLSTPVKQIRKESFGFSIITDQQTISSNQLVLATDTRSGARLLNQIFPQTKPLEEMPHASMCAIHLGFSRASIDHPLNGFGILISRARGIRTLGTLFSSTLFPHRAPHGHVLLTVFMGGVHDPKAVFLDDSSLIKITLADLTPLLKITGHPIFQNIVRWQHTIPQYEQDYPLVQKFCTEVETAYPGLYLIGNYRKGISLENCLAYGQKLGKSI